MNLCEAKIKIYKNKFYPTPARSRGCLELINIQSAGNQLVILFTLAESSETARQLSNYQLYTFFKLIVKIGVVYYFIIPPLRGRRRRGNRIECNLEFQYNE